MYTDLIALYRLAEECRDQRISEAERERLIQACRGQRRRFVRRPRVPALLERIRALSNGAYLQGASGPEAPEQAPAKVGLLQS